MVLPRDSPVERGLERRGKHMEKTDRRQCASETHSSCSAPSPPTATTDSDLCQHVTGIIHKHHDTQRTTQHWYRKQHSSSMCVIHTIPHYSCTRWRWTIDYRGINWQIVPYSLILKWLFSRLSISVTIQKLQQILWCLLSHCLSIHHVHWTNNRLVTDTV